MTRHVLNLSTAIVALLTLAPVDSYAQTAAQIGSAQASGALPSAPGGFPGLAGLSPEEQNRAGNALGDERALVERLRGQTISGLMGTVIDASEIQSPIAFAITTDRDQGRSLTFLSVNGRYAIRGVLWDNWTNTIVTDMDTFRQVNGRINFELIGLNAEDLDPFVIGQGPNLVRVFVDPMCPYCKAFFRRLIEDPMLLRNYTYELYLVPFLGEPSVEAVRGLSCSEDRDEAIRILLEGNDRAARNLGAQFTPQNCNPEIMLRRLIASQQLGVTGVPFFIRHDNVPYAGLPPNVGLWLNSAERG